MSTQRRLYWATQHHAAAVGLVFAITCALTLAAPSVAFGPPTAETGALWLPAGAGLAMLLMGGVELWPSVLAGSLAANVLASSQPVPSLALACAATAQAYIGAHIVNVFAGGTRVLEQSRTFIAFIAGAGIIGSAMGPGLGRMLLDVLADAPTFTTNASVMRWWIADAASTVVIAPAFLMWHGSNTQTVLTRSLWEHIGAVIALVVTWFVSFGGRLPADLAHAPLEVVCVPALLWTAYRFGLRPASLAVAALSVVALQGTLGGAGPFAPSADGAFMVALEAFVGVTAATTFALAIVTGERRTAVAELEKAARTDALTGLANYGRFAEALAAESARAMRSGRQFALLFMDVDRLKRINDTYGHLAGNEAICRVANALRVTCREIDIVARIGGDEFCVLLPDSDENAAWNAAGRVARLLRSLPASLSVCVSAGVSVYPRDGVTPDSLLAAADAVLYKAKGFAHTPSSAVVVGT